MDTALLPGRFYRIYSSHLLRWELKKHNSVLLIQFLILFLSDIIHYWILLGLQRIFIRNNFPLKQNSEKCHPRFHWWGKVKGSGKIHSLSEVAQPAVIFQTFSEELCFMLRTPNFLLQQQFFEQENPGINGYKQTL